MAEEKVQSELVMSRSFLPALRWSRRVRAVSGSSTTQASGAAMMPALRRPSMCWASTTSRTRT